ncbi:MAG: 16S rRNA (cytosine(1402)-N(4))-methyltransferase RsmH [Dehalococcoidia bacterium]
MTDEETKLEHESVMVREVVEALNVKPGGRYVDGTVGAGGHAEAIMEAASPGGQLLGIDKDPDAIEAARERLARFGDDVRLEQGDYAEMDRICREIDFAPVHGVLLDLGLSSLQLGRAERGFSFQREGPLDMRFSPEQTLTAADIVNEYSEQELADLLWRFGEEPRSRRIARRIVERRPLETTTALAKAVEEAVGGRARRQSHPATRTFQALRIAVNQELLSLADVLPLAYGLLGDLGRLGVLSYHSLEDRAVKAFVQRESRDCICPPRLPVCTCGHKATLRPVTRGALRPSDEEVARNPRSRSARLRVAERLPASAA